MERLQVLQQQLCAGQAAQDIAVCPKELGKFLTHDNPELRAKIFEFLKASLPGGRFKAKGYPRPRATVQAALNYG